MSVIGDLLHKIQYGAGVADKPARVVRNTLGGQNPLAGLTDFSNSEVVDNPAAPSGRDLLQQYGVLGANTPGLDMGDVAGVAGEIATDPLSYLGGLGLAAKGVGALGKGAGMLGRGVRGAIGATKGVKGAAAAAKAAKAGDAIATVGKAAGKTSVRQVAPDVARALPAAERVPGGLRAAIAASDAAGNAALPAVRPNGVMALADHSAEAALPLAADSVPKYGPGARQFMNDALERLGLGGYAPVPSPNGGPRSAIPLQRQGMPGRGRQKLLDSAGELPPMPTNADRLRGIEEAATRSVGSGPTITAGGHGQARVASNKAGQQAFGTAQETVEQAAERLKREGADSASTVGTGPVINAGGPGQPRLTARGPKPATGVLGVDIPSGVRAAAGAAGLRAAGYLAGSVDATPGDEATPGDPAEDAANGTDWKMPGIGVRKPAVTAATKDYPLDLGPSMGDAPPKSGYELRGADQNVFPRVGAPGAGLGARDLRSAIATAAELHPQTGIVHSGSLRDQPWYQDYLNMARKGANMTQEQRMSADMPTQIAAVNQKYTDPGNRKAGLSLNAEDAKQKAWAQAGSNQAAREAARQATLASRSAAQQQAADKQAEQWMMTNHPAAYAAIQQAKSEEAIAQAKIAAGKGDTPEGKMAFIQDEAKKGNLLPGSAAGIEGPVMSEYLRGQEIKGGILGPHTRAELKNLYDNGPNMEWGPDSKESFLQHVANSGSGIDPKHAAEWWDANVAGRGIVRGIGSMISPSLIHPWAK